MITQSELKQILHYSQDTGIFTWLINHSHGKKLKGKTAGCFNSFGYLFIKTKGIIYKGHRLAFLYMTGVIPEEVDHINHNTSDNRWCNLRPSNRIENSHNSSISSANTTGATGVYKDNIYDGWVARISINSTSTNLGYFKNKNDAIIARKMAEYEHGYHVNHGT